MESGSVNEYNGYTLDGSAVDVVNVDSFSPEQFFERYVALRKPCVLNGVMNDLDVGHWSVDYLNGKVGESVVFVEKRESDEVSFGKGSKIAVEMKEFLKFIEEGSTEFYLTSQPYQYDANGFVKLLSAPVDGLVGDITLRPVMMGNLVPQQINLWMGNTLNGSSSGLHHDYHDNLYILVQGKKKFRLFSPKDAEKMYTQGNIEHVYPNGLINYEGFPTNDDGSDKTIGLLVNVLDKAQNITNDNLVNHIDAESDEIDNMLDDFLDDMMDVSDFSFEDDFKYDDDFNEKMLYSEEDDDAEPVNFSQVSLSAKGDYDKTNFPLFADAVMTEVTIQAGQILYLPAGWFHEVTSYSTEKSGVHTALNYWFHPSVENNFEKPYGDDSVWEKIWNNSEH